MVPIAKREVEDQAPDRKNGPGSEQRCVEDRVQESLIRLAETFPGEDRVVGFDLRYAVGAIRFEGDVDNSNDYGPGDRPDMNEEAPAPFGDVRGAAKSVEQFVSADEDRKRHGHFFGIERTDVERQ